MIASLLCWHYNIAVDVVISIYTSSVFLPLPLNPEMFIKLIAMASSKYLRIVFQPSKFLFTVLRNSYITARAKNQFLP